MKKEEEIEYAPGTIMAKATQRSRDYLASPMTERGHSVPDRGRRGLNTRGETPAQEKARLQKEESRSLLRQLAAFSKRNPGMGDNATRLLGAIVDGRTEASKVASRNESLRSLDKNRNIGAGGRLNNRLTPNVAGAKSAEWTTEVDDAGYPVMRTRTDGTTQMFDEETNSWGKEFGGPIVTKRTLTQLDDGTFSNEGGGTDITRNGRPARDKIVLPGQKISSFNRKMFGLDALRMADSMGRVSTPAAQQQQASPVQKATTGKKKKKSSVNPLVDPATSLMLKFTEDYARMQAGL